MTPLEMFRIAGRLGRANQHAFLEWFEGRADIEQECLAALIELIDRGKIKPKTIRCPYCDGIGTVIDRFNHGIFHECPRCRGKKLERSP